MGFSPAMAFRDCPHCGATYAQMGVRMQDNQAATAEGRLRCWTFLTCPACAGAVVLETSLQNESPAVLDILPADNSSTLGVAHLPEDVESYYRDALRVLRAGVPDAAAVQLRRTLEAAAAHFDIEERTLVKSIEALIEQGHVTKSFGGALHHIREVGNVGAHHTDERLDDTTVRRAIRFTSALLRNLFEVPAELAALKEEAPPA